MYSLINKKKSTKADILKYKPAVYAKKSKVKYVYFYVLDPQSVYDGEPRLKRIRTKFNSYESARERDAAALRYRDEVNKKLAGGWNPLIECSSKKSWTPTEEVLELYKRYIGKLQKDDVLTANSYRDYSSRLRIFTDYVMSHPVPYICMIDRPYLETYLDYIYVDRDSTPRSRNNHRCWLSSFCNYLVDYGYMAANPCMGIKPLRNGEKIRKALTREDRIKLFTWLEENDKWFLLACQFHYYTLIRPGEMSEIKMKDISVKNQTVFISKNISKNRRDGVVTIPTVLMRRMIELGVLNNPSDYYLFGDGFIPSSQHKASSQFNKRWVEVREALSFPVAYQFYSLKDTGITDIINKVGLNVAKDQARHSSVAVTNHYASTDQMHAHPELKNFE